MRAQGLRPVMRLARVAWRTGAPFGRDAGQHLMTAFRVTIETTAGQNQPGFDLNLPLVPPVFQRDGVNPLAFWRVR